MKNLDLKNNFASQMAAAVAANDNAAIAKAWTDYAEALEQSILADAQELVGQYDASILASRGVRQLTTQEKNFYAAMMQVVRADDPRQTWTGTDNVIPKTVIDQVFDDLRREHPILAAIDFVNTGAAIEWILNTNATQLATWGALDATISKELSSGFKKVSLSLNKLSAYMVVAKSLLDLGPEWLDRYVRGVLAEAIAYGLEDGIINGTGKNQPIGMIKKISGATDGTYPAKAATTVTKLDVATYASILGTIAKDSGGKYRKVPELLLVCNPADYYSKIIPATTIRGVDGTYRNDIFPYPTKVIVSAQMASDKAVFGIAKNYFMGIGTAKGGKIEYSDEYKFLEEERTYITKLYGHGQAKDENDFVYADISGLVGDIPTVNVNEIAGVVKTKEQTA